jgi:hypothetical protein
LLAGSAAGDTMKLHDKNYLGDVYERIDKSVKRANELLVNYQKDKATVEQLQAVLAQEQLATHTKS